MAYVIHLQTGRKSFRLTAVDYGSAHKAYITLFNACRHMIPEVYLYGYEDGEYVLLKAKKIERDQYGRECTKVIKA